MTARIPVGGEHHALVDDADVDLVSGYDWTLLRGNNGKLYAYCTNLPGRIVYMHRLIAGTPAGMETDHRNGDGLDNQRGNLRVATRSQNKANTGKRRGRFTSQYKGVSWDAARHQWQAKIRTAGRTRSLGRFDDEAAAARAYDAAAVDQWAEFAQLNFPAAVPA